MEIAGSGKRVRIYLGEHDRAGGRQEPLWETLLNLLREEGAAGATMVKGQAGFGVHGKLHVARLADLAPDLPVVVEWIDGAERVERLMPSVSSLVRTGLITVESIDVVRYTHREPAPLPADRVGKVMTQDVVFVRAETPLGEVVRTLLDRDFRALPVLDESSHVVGIVTNRDLVERGGLSGRVELLAVLGGGALERELGAAGMREKRADDVMSRQVVTVGPDEPLDRAAHLMVERKIKRLPVVDGDGRLVGMLSRVDVLRTMGETYVSPASGAPPRRAVGGTIAEIVRRDAPVVRVDAPLGEVLDAVTGTRLNRAVVVDDERRVVGIVSDAELLRRLDPEAQMGLLPALMRRSRTPLAGGAARDVMRTPAHTLSQDAPIEEAIRVMLETRRKILPVTDADGRLVGVVDRADLLSASRAAA